MLDAAERGATEDKATMVQRSAELEEELQVLRASVVEAAAAEETAQVEAGRQEALVKEANMRVKEAEREHQQADRLHKAMDKKRSSLEQAKQQGSNVIEGIFPMLATGGWEDDETRDYAVMNVQEHLKLCGVEKVLVETAPKSLEKRPDDRGAFDKATVDHVAEVLKQRVTGLEAELQAGADAAMEARVEALGMWAVADIARDKAAKAEVLKVEAQGTLHDASVKHKSLNKQVADRERKVSTCLANLTLFGEKAKHIEAAKAAFERLRTNEYPEPEAQMETAATDNVDVAPMEVEPATAELDVSMEPKEVEAPKADALTATARALCGA
jgi:hypothetical protein